MCTCSISEGIKTTTTGGKLVYHLFIAFAEFQRDLIIENTVLGLEAASRPRGDRSHGVSADCAGGAHHHGAGPTAWRRSLNAEPSSLLIQSHPILGCTVLSGYKDIVD